MTGDLLSGFILIEVCENNLASAKDILALEQEVPGLSILTNDCMSECELCSEQPYVFFDGEVKSADDVPSLLQLLRDLLGHSQSDMENETS